MLRTPLCERLGIEVPVIAAPFGPWEQVVLDADALAEIVRRVVAEAEAVLDRLRFTGAV